MMTEKQTAETAAALQVPPVLEGKGRALSGRIEVASGGRQWTLLRPESLDVLWEAMTEEEFTEDERLPYWVELWPASLVLAEWLTLNRDRIRDRVCLDVGCGLGFTALVASRLGARVVGMDYEVYERYLVLKADIDALVLKYNNTQKNRYNNYQSRLLYQFFFFGPNDLFKLRLYVLKEAFLYCRVFCFTQLNTHPF